MGNILENRFFRFVRYTLTLVLFITFLVYSYTFGSRYLNEKVYTINVSQGIDEIKRNFNDQRNLSKGQRSSKINARFDEAKNVLYEVEYKDVKLVSTKDRVFSDKEISTLKLIIDLLPQKLFDYRPWAIISTSFTDTEIFNVNPEGVAFSSGPNVFVGDVTFTKKDSYDTGTFRGLMRVISHEFVHNAQFFETRNVPEDYSDSYLENSEIVMDWINSTGWEKVDGAWVLGKGEKTTEYGKTNPVEDMADSIGSLLIGEEYSISQNRIEWILKWLGVEKDALFQGTIPLSQTIKQRRVENNDSYILNKYKDANASSQDIINFQSTQTISKKDFANYYANEFKKRGWSGTINTLGIGEFTYLNKYKVNLEMDSNPLRVVTIVMTVY